MSRYDDELTCLDEEVAELQSRVADLEMECFNIRTEWDEVFPADELEWALQTIYRLADKVLDLHPEDLEAQELIQEAQSILVPAMEPELFHLK